MLESSSLSGMKGLNAVISTAPGKLPLANANCAIGNSPVNVTSSMCGAPAMLPRDGPKPN